MNAERKQNLRDALILAGIEEINEFVQSENARFENLIKTKGFGDRYGKK